MIHSARYRPIVPRPPVLDNLPALDLPPPSAARAPARTPRARKRGSPSCSFVSHKRYRACVPVLPSPALDASCLQTTLAGLARGVPMLALSPPSCSPRDEAEERDVKKRDLLGGMQRSATSAIIAPQPVRPVGSSITIEAIVDSSAAAACCPPTRKKLGDVEEEVESEVLPTIVSDAGNRVRLTNSAYNKMVGQPKCPWLDSIGGSTGSGRISGEVILDLQGGRIHDISRSFSCKVRIEWRCNGQETFVCATCDVERLCCESKACAFAWRFHTVEASSSTSCH